MPVELRVIDPREREFKKAALKTNEAGLVALELPFEAFQDTGSYHVALRVADREVASYGLQVEEFVPERMKVTAGVDKPGYLQGSVVPVKVEAAYLFGGSAGGSPVELTCRLEPSEFKPKENANFTYGVYRQKGSEAKAVTLGQVKGEVNDKGQVLVECPAKETAGGFKGPARLVAQASVFEAGSGRATLGEAVVPMHPESYYVGLQSGVQKVTAGKPFTVTGVVVDWDGKLFSDAKALKPLEVEYLRLDEEYGYYYDEGEGYERYQRFLRPVREGRTTAKVEGGKFQLQVTPAEDAAGFIVRVRSGSAQTDLQLEGNGRYYWYGDGESRVDQTPRPLKPASIALELPKQGRLNEPIAVKFKVPYRGRVLLTAETDRVVASEWKAVEPGEVSWTFTPKTFAPNVYVSAFLVKDPHLESARGLHAGSGLRRGQRHPGAHGVHADGEAGRAQGGPLQQHPHGEPGAGHRRRPPPSPRWPWWTRASSRSRASRARIRSRSCSPSAPWAWRPTRRSAGRCWCPQEATRAPRAVTRAARAAGCSR